MTGPPKRTGHRQSPAISHLALCLLLRRPRAISCSLSVIVLLRVLRRRRPFRFRPLNSPSGADPNFEFRQNGSRPPTSRRRRVRFVPPEPRGGRHPLVSACRPSPFLAAPLFRSGAFLLSKERAARMMPARDSRVRSPASSPPPLRKRNAKAEQSKSTVRNGDGRSKPGTQQQTSSGGRARSEAPRR